MIESLIFLVLQQLAHIRGGEILASADLPMVASGSAKIGGRWFVPHPSLLEICHRLLYMASGRLIGMCDTRLAPSWQFSPLLDTSWQVARCTPRWRGTGRD